MQETRKFEVSGDELTEIIRQHLIKTNYIDKTRPCSSSVSCDQPSHDSKDPRERPGPIKYRFTFTFDHEELEH